MKKPIITILIAACLLSSSACRKAGYYVDNIPSEKPVESTEEVETTASETSEPEQSESASEETSETTPADSSAESTDATTSTTAAKPVVKVTAEKKTIKDTENEGSKFKVYIPQVTISGKDTSAVNSKIKSDINKKKWGSTYSYYKNDKIVSILVELQGYYDNDFERKVYNISVSTGKIMSDSDVVKLAGSTDKKFFAQVKKAYKKDVFGTSYKYGAMNKKQALKIRAKLRKKNLKRISYKYLDPYINNKGKLKWVSSRYVYNLEAGQTEVCHT